MKTRIVTSKEIESCPKKRLDAKHYLSVKYGCARKKKEGRLKI